MWTEIVTAGSSIVIAFATVGTLSVYRRMSKQIEAQINLTRDTFLESHAPALFVSFEKCVYSKDEGRLVGVIVVKNHGTVAANEIDLTIQFGGTNAVRSVNRVAIQPGNRLTYPFALEMNATKYENGQTQGNRVNSYVSGSYKGLDGTKYKYNEKAEFYSEFRRFVPFWTGTD
jgi:hypothetical protein